MLLFVLKAKIFAYVDNRLVGKKNKNKKVRKNPPENGLTIRACAKNLSLFQVSRTNPEYEFLIPQLSALAPLY